MEELLEVGTDPRAKVQACKPQFTNYPPATTPELVQSELGCLTLAPLLGHNRHSPWRAQITQKKHEYVTDTFVLFPANVATLGVMPDTAQKWHERNEGNMLASFMREVKCTGSVPHRNSPNCLSSGRFLSSSVCFEGHPVHKPWTKLSQSMPIPSNCTCHRHNQRA